jgi:hypothetical protein
MFHSLHHSFASWLAALGTDFKTWQELIGHSSGEATQIYVHAFNPNKRSAIEKLRLPRKAVLVGLRSHLVTIGENPWTVLDNPLEWCYLPLEVLSIGAVFRADCLREGWRMLFL